MSVKDKRLPFLYLCRMLKVSPPCPNDYLFAEKEDYENREQYEEDAKKFKKAVEQVAQDLFKKHHLDLTESEVGGVYEIAPTETWEKAAQEIIETIHGVGLFHFSSLEEFLNVGPHTTLEDAVLAHLEWIPDYPEVYDGVKARTLVERKLR